MKVNFNQPQCLRSMRHSNCREVESRHGVFTLETLKVIVIGSESAPGGKRVITSLNNLHLETTVIKTLQTKRAKLLAGQL